MFVDGAEHCALGDASGGGPGVDPGLDPPRDGHRPDVPRLPQEVGDHPVLLPLLNRLDLQGEQFAATEAATDRHRERRMVAPLTQRDRSHARDEASPLLRSPPVAEAYADSAQALHAANARGEFRTEHVPSGTASRSVWAVPLTVGC